MRLRLHLVVQRQVEHTTAVHRLHTQPSQLPGEHPQILCLQQRVKTGTKNGIATKRVTHHLTFYI